MTDIPILFTPVQTAKIMGISRSQVYVLMNRGELGSVNIGRSRRITRQQMDTILNITLSIPFDQRTMFTVSGGRFIRSADIPNYAFTNNSALIGVTWRF